MTISRLQLFNFSTPNAHRQYALCNNNIILIIGILCKNFCGIYYHVYIWGSISIFSEYISIFVKHLIEIMKER